MNWDDLKYFLALLRAGTLSAAARTLTTEHTTIARRIASLEEQLSVRLFERSARGFTLTPEGEAMVELAERIEQETFNIERLAQSRQSRLSGVVRITAPPTFASRFLAPRLVTLRRQHPGIEIELVGDSRSVSLSRREADIAIRLSRPQTPSIVARRLGTMAYGLYGERSYVVQTAEGAQELVGYDESLDHVPQQQWLRSICSNQRIVFRSNELAVLHEAAASGIGLAALPRFLGDEDERLVLVDRAKPPPGRELWLLVHPDLRRSPRIRAVIDHLVAMTVAERAVLDPSKAPVSQGRLPDEL
jgi:DNA-binding transcriptional LysR family regulator